MIYCGNNETTLSSFIVCLWQQTCSLTEFAIFQFAISLISPEIIFYIMISDLCIFVHFTRWSEKRGWKQVRLVARTMHVFWVVLQQSWSRFSRTAGTTLPRSCLVFFHFCYGGCYAEVLDFIPLSCRFLFAITPIWICVVNEKLSVFSFKETMNGYQLVSVPPTLTSTILASTPAKVRNDENLNILILQLRIGSLILSDVVGGNVWCNISIFPPVQPKVVPIIGTFLPLD